MKRDYAREHEARIKTELVKIAKARNVCVDEPDQKLLDALRDAYDKGRRRGKEDALIELEKNHFTKGTGRHP